MNFNKKYQYKSYIKIKFSLNLERGKIGIELIKNNDY